MTSPCTIDESVLETMVVHRSLPSTQKVPVGVDAVLNGSRPGTPARRRVRG